VTGELYYGSKLNDTLRAFGSAQAIAGQPFYVSDENGEKTYVGSVGVDGAVTNLRLFAERGGESVTADDQGNVYIAAGQVFIYNQAGDPIDTIEIPERPSQLLFGGSDGHTLFVLARSSLYAIRTTHRGR
jgi:sugar lactone lactonase YvrE